MCLSCEACRITMPAAVVRFNRRVIIPPAHLVTAHERGYRIFAENLRRYVAGEELLNVVDKMAGY